MEKWVTDRRTDGWTNGQTEGRMDKASYRDAWTHLKMGHFEGYFRLFWGCGGGPKGPGWGKYPFQMWMIYYDEVICGWCGYLWLHDITLTI